MLDSFIKELDDLGALRRLDRDARYRLRQKNQSISLRNLRHALAYCGQSLSPTPDVCVTKLGGLRAAARASGLSVNTVRDLVCGRSTLKSYLRLAEAAQKRPKPVKINPRAALWTAQDDRWTTPPDLLDKIYPLLPGAAFDLDPCSPQKGPDAPVRARVHYTKEDDGLSLPWSGLCFVNPPFSFLQIWLDKAIREASEHGATVIFLCPARVDARWWHDKIAGKIPAVILQGRLSFGGGGEESRGKRAPFATALLLIGADADLQEAVQKATSGWAT